LTEWEDFKNLNPDSIKKLVKNQIIIDSRNILNRDLWMKSGFKYIGNGW
jgi:UDPglucose 6-dehydrogenase